MLTTEFPLASNSRPLINNSFISTCTTSAEIFSGSRNLQNFFCRAYCQRQKHFLAFRFVAQVQMFIADKIFHGGKFFCGRDVRIFSAYSPQILRNIQNLVDVRRNFYVFDLRRVLNFFYVGENIFLQLSNSRETFINGGLGVGAGRLQRDDRAH